jgi:hypothetical protein
VEGKLMERKQTVAVKKVHDNDKYIVTTTIFEEMNGAELLSIYGKVIDEQANTKQMLTDMPKQAKAREEYLQKNMDVITTSAEALAPWCEPMIADKKAGLAEAQK